MLLLHDLKGVLWCPAVLPVHSPVEEEELEVAEVTKEIIKDVVTKGNGEILYKYAPNTADELLDAIINVVGILNTFIRVSYTLSGLLYGYRFTKLMYFMYLKPRFETV